MWKYVTAGKFLTFSKLKIAIPVPKIYNICATDCSYDWCDF